MIPAFEVATLRTTPLPDVPRGTVVRLANRSAPYLVTEADGASVGLVPLSGDDAFKLMRANPVGMHVVAYAADLILQGSESAGQRGSAVAPGQSMGNRGWPGTRHPQQRRAGLLE